MGKILFKSILKITNKISRTIKVWKKTKIKYFTIVFKKNKIKCYFQNTLKKIKYFMLPEPESSMSKLAKVGLA